MSLSWGDSIIYNSNNGLLKLAGISEINTALPLVWVNTILLRSWQNKTMSSLSRKTKQNSKYISQGYQRPLKLLSIGSGWQMPWSSLICPLDGNWGSECLNKLSGAQELPRVPGSSILKSTEYSCQGKLQRVRDGVGEAPGLHTPIYLQQIFFFLFYKMGFQGSVWSSSNTPQSTYWKPISYYHIAKYSWSLNNHTVKILCITFDSIVGPSHL